MHVEVVRELDGPHELRELVLEIFAAGVRGHEIVLHGNGETLAHSVPGERALGLGQHSCGGLVRHTRGDALVEAVHVPLELLIGVLEIHVRQDVFCEGRVGGVGDKTVDPVREVLVVALEGIRKMPPLVPLVALLVELDVSSGGPENIFVLLEGGVIAGSCVRAPAAHAGVAGFEVHTSPQLAACMSLPFADRRHVAIFDKVVYTKTPITFMFV